MVFFFSLLGKYPVLGFENEKKLVAHILKLGDAGFPPEKTTIRHLAYQFAEQMGLKHNFNKESEMAGPQWLKSFLERNPQIVLRQAEGLSIQRAKGLNRAEVAKFFDLLMTILTENNLLDKPDRIFNMDESGVQLNNKTGKVLAKKGARAVKSLTSGEKGETITVVACCNATGNFLPPVLIIKGVNKKPEFEEGLPPGSKVYMQKKSAYISSELFYKWLTEEFIPRKPTGKVLLILDGHSSHSSAVNMLETARDNDVILLCLPSHTTSALQPLDVSVFGPFKKYYYAETNSFMRTNPQKKINRYNSGQLIAKAWIRAATPANAISGFRGSGIFPFNSNALSDAEFAISDLASEELAHKRDSGLLNDQVLGVSEEPALREPVQESEESALLERLQESESDRGLPLDQLNELSPLNCIVLRDADENQLENFLNDTELMNNANQSHTLPRPSSSLMIFSEDCLVLGDNDIENYIVDGTGLLLPSLISSNESQNENLDKETPSKFLQQSCPIPKIPLSFSKRAKQSAEILNSNNKIVQKKNKVEKMKKTKKTTETKITTAKQNDKSIIKKPSSIRKSSVGKREQAPKKKKTKKYSGTTSSETESDEADFVELSKKRTLRKRIMHSSDSENEKNISSSKEKVTERVPIKKKNDGKSTRDIEKILKVKNANSKEENNNKKVSVDDYCVECFENYNFTKSKSDWVQCEICRMWLHETCTTFKNHCMRCGKVKTLASCNN